jgi:hypothetical protein
MTTPTPNSAEMLALAERIEHTSGPDAYLDLEIHKAVKPEGSVRYALTDAPNYCGSLDAAMTLAEDYGGEVTFFKDGTAKAFLWQPYPMAVEAKGATPALALCAAALRALASKDTGHGR